MFLSVVCTYSDLTSLFITEDTILHVCVNKLNVNNSLEPANLYRIIYCQCIVSQTNCSHEYGIMVVHVYVCIYGYIDIYIWCAVNLTLKQCI